MYGLGRVCRSAGVRGVGSVLAIFLEKKNKIKKYRIKFIYVYTYTHTPLPFRIIIADSPYNKYISETRSSSVDRGHIIRNRYKIAIQSKYIRVYTQHIALCISCIQ